MGICQLPGGGGGGCCCCHDDNVCMEVQIVVVCVAYKPANHTAKQPCQFGYFSIYLFFVVVVFFLPLCWPPHLQGDDTVLIKETDEKFHPSNKIKSDRQKQTTEEKCE